MQKSVEPAYILCIPNALKRPPSFLFLLLFATLLLFFLPSCLYNRKLMFSISIIYRYHCCWLNILFPRPQQRYRTSICFCILF